MGMAELTDKWEVVSKLITLQNNYNFFKNEWDAERLYREIAKLEIEIGNTPGLQLVRCKDCRWTRKKDHREPTDTPRELICLCFKHHYIPAPWGARMAVNPDDFCSHGERRTEC